MSYFNWQGNFTAYSWTNFDRGSTVCNYPVLCYVYTMFLAVTAARNVARRGVLVIFVFVFKFCYVSLRSLTVYQTVGRIPESPQLTTFKPTVYHGCLYVSSWLATICCDLSRFVTFRSSSVTSIKFCQGFLWRNVDDGWCLGTFVPTVLKRGLTAAASIVFWTLNLKIFNDDDFIFRSLQIAWRIHPFFASRKRLPAVTEWGEQYATGRYT